VTLRLHKTVTLSRGKAGGRGSTICIGAPAAKQKEEVVMFRLVRKGFVVRSGLTLLELVVVMAILAALAGILIPLMPNMIGKVIWKQLTEAYRSDGERAKDLATALLYWLDHGGSPPVVTGNDEFDRLVVWTSCLALVKRYDKPLQRFSPSLRTTEKG
jgi:prepilin-type N-terminal cleavage/methylation domain-containing protein